VYGDGDGAVQRRVRDVEGLSKIDYTVSYTKVESVQAPASARRSRPASWAASRRADAVETFAAPALVDMIAA